MKSDKESGSQPVPAETGGSYTLGSRKAWSSVFGAFLLQTSVWGPVSAFGVFEDFYTRSLLKTFSPSTISWIGSVELFLGLSMGFIGGRLYDSGYCRLTMLAGSLIFLLGFFMLSLVKEGQYYQIFLSQGLCLGFGLSLIYVPSFTLVSHHFKSRKALAMGVLAASTPLGGVVYSIMLNQLIQLRTGFAWGVRAAAFLTLGCSVCGHLLIYVPPHVASPRTGDVPTKAQNSILLRNPPYLLTLLSGFIGQLGTYFPVFYVQLFAQRHNVSSTLTFYAIAILNVAGIFGRIVPNYFADRYGVIEGFIVCSGLSGFVGFAMLGCGSSAGLVLFCIFYGFFFNSTISLYIPLAAAITPKGADVGFSLGIAVAPVGVASLIGSPMIGAIIGKDFVWWKGIIFASLCLVGASVIAAVARYLHIREARRAAPVALSSEEKGLE
ncbi:MFS general substrate transporter [Agrocybe pediades]|nr:MFS general substrate transporter [Agrocybe pediades]